MLLIATAVQYAYCATLMNCHCDFIIITNNNYAPLMFTQFMWNVKYKLKVSELSTTHKSVYMGPHS